MDRQKKDVYIWGAGHGFEIVSLCLKKDTIVKGVIDIDKMKKGKNIYGLKIYSPDEIDLINSQIIISVVNYEDIKLELLRLGCNMDNIYIFFDAEKKSGFKDLISESERKKQLYLFQNEKKMLDIETDIIRVTKIVNVIYPILNDRKIVLGGEQEYCEKFYYELKSEIRDKVWGKISLSNKMNIPCRDYKNCNELLKEPIEKLDVFIIDPKLKIKYLGTLLEMGFDSFQIKFVGKALLGGNKKMDTYDIQLGYTRIDDLPGFTIFGNDKDEKAYKIVTLGNSTSDPKLFNIKSWSEYLYEQLSQEGFNVCVYAGGMGCYTVSQELFKLERDVLTLNPDLVLSYSGITDAGGLYYDVDYPFILNYQKNLLYEVAEKGIIYNTWQRNIPISSISVGLKTNEENANHWMKCQKMMYAICKQFGIEFYGFLQPYNTKWVDTSGEIKNIERFYKQAMKILEKEENIDWLNNFTNIFDSYENIFFDSCHVYERGNKIIANQIRKIAIRNYSKIINKY